MPRVNKPKTSFRKVHTEANRVRPPFAFKGYARAKQDPRNPIHTLTIYTYDPEAESIPVHVLSEGPMQDLLEGAYRKGVEDGRRGEEPEPEPEPEA